MADTQLKEPNLDVIGSSDECLVYAREIFGVSAKYANAAVAWTEASYKHAGATPPTDIAVPVWFSYDGPTNGHVAVSVPGKGVYSVSAEGDKVFLDVAGLEAFIPGTSYLGWSEDIDGVRVVEVEATPAPEPSGGTLTLSADNTPFHLYKPGGPYVPSNPANVLGMINPAEFGGLSYPIIASLGNGVYRIKSEDYGEGDLWTNGSNVTVS